IVSPLTPALSLGERESPHTAFAGSSDLRFAARLATIPPLPKGEGRGEEAQTVRLNQLRSYRNLIVSRLNPAVSLRARQTRAQVARFERAEASPASLLVRRNLDRHLHAFPHQLYQRALLRHAQAHARLLVRAVQRQARPLAVAGEPHRRLIRLG